MPEIVTGGNLSIVAHQDDDLLFMNPDIDRSITAGQSNVTVYLTAGDAGMDDWYWQGRETGVKQAYALMAGVQTWVDETISVTGANGDFQIATAYLADAPGIRLYFLRLPDGGGALAPGQEDTLGRLESGALAQVDTVDDSATYTRADLVSVLTSLMDLHAPSGMRLQVNEGPTAEAEHTDHRHVTEFAQEALGTYSGGPVTVTHYVNYDSRLLPENLTTAEASRALEIMQTYSAHDPNTWNADGGLQQVYVDWTARQYVADEYVIENGEITDLVTPDRPDVLNSFFTLTGEDSTYFVVDPTTGVVTPQPWFQPSLADARDANGDHIYEVTRIGPDPVSDVMSSQVLYFQTQSDGGLTSLTAAEFARFQPPFSLDGVDADLFSIDSITGVISVQSWFVPKTNDAWDSNQDHIYEVVRTELQPDGSVAETEVFQWQTVAEGVLQRVTQTGDAGTYSLEGTDAFYFSVDGDSGEIILRTSNTTPNPALEQTHVLELVFTPDHGGRSMIEEIVLETNSDGTLRVVQQGASRLETIMVPAGGGQETALTDVPTSTALDTEAWML